MTRYRSILWSLGTVCLAALISFLVSRETLRHAESESPSRSSEKNFHDWLHENLAITSDQETVLKPHEVAFEEDRNRIRGEIESAGRNLADAIRSFDVDSSEVGSARDKLTRLQGELQQSTLDHFFAMKEHLTAEQGEKLVQWTHDSIIHGNHD